MRLTQKAIIGILVFQLLGSALSGYVFFTRGSQELRQDFAVRVESVVQAIAQSSSVIFCKETSAQKIESQFLEKILVSGGLTYIVVRDEEKIVSQWGLQTSESASSEKTLGSRIQEKIEKERLYTAFAEFSVCNTGDVQDQREIEVGVSFSVLDQSLNRLIQSIAINLVILMLIGALVGFFFSRLIERKVVSIQTLLKNISQDKFSNMGIADYANDEFGDIEREVHATGKRLISLNDERDKQRLRLSSASKLSSLGEMAGGVAHEINNPLAIITGRLDQLKRTIEKDPLDKEKLRSLLSNTNETVSRINQIVRGLKLFSRNAEGDPKISCSLKSIVNDSIGICGEKFRSTSFAIRLSIDIEASVLCRPTQISQVIINLMGNSYDACSALKDPWIEITIKKSLDGLRVELRVTDCGPGISTEIADRIMDPFFSTKEVGKGTGLGLSVSKGIIEEHGGKFYLDRNSPHTSFVIELPAVD